MRRTLGLRLAPSSKTLRANEGGESCLFSSQTLFVPYLRAAFAALSISPRPLELKTDQDQIERGENTLPLRTNGLMGLLTMAVVKWGLGGSKEARRNPANGSRLFPNGSLAQRRKTKWVDCLRNLSPPPDESTATVSACSVYAGSRHSGKNGAQTHDPRKCADEAKSKAKNATALHWAAKQGRLEMAEMMAQAGVDINVKSGYTALHLAALHGQHHVIQLLLNTYNAKANIRDYHGKTAMHYWSGSADVFNRPGSQSRGKWSRGRRVQRYAHLPSLLLSSRTRSQRHPNLERATAAEGPPASRAGTHSSP
ncbi:hypothetical protein SKAU_G00306420 [Synaphobranchus kaupii]|uniref:Uncharacterized protein n=1 Tax=Synaphobranchus kaupii TaxID=118154 RepID=A0A9Q1EQU0_SYNKA|nr:hypothetical protein SKAU_G00306420 [Synaphobranchus kaupii]